MKKITILISLLLLASLVLAACSSSNTNGNGTPNAAGALGTPGVIGTTGAAGNPGVGVNGTAAVPAAGTAAAGTAAAGTATVASNTGTGISTPDVSTPAAMAATPAAGTSGAVAATPGAATPGAATPGAAGAAATTPAAGASGAAAGTPAAMIPMTGEANTCSANLLSNVLDKNIVDAQNMVQGKVTGLVLLRDAQVYNSMGSGNGMQTTPAGVAATGKGMGMGTGTPAAGMTGTTGNTPGTVMMGQGVPPRVEYVVVALDKSVKNANGDHVLVPFAALKPMAATTNAPAGNSNNTANNNNSGKNNSSNSSNNNANGANANGGANANAAGDCGWTLSAPATALTTAPAFTTAKMPDFAATGWEKNFNSFWANQGMSIPATGASGSQYGAPAFFDGKISDLHMRNAGSEDLGEVKDFLMDPATGQATYAVVGMGGFLGIGEKYVLVPLKQAAWVSDSSSNNKNNGYLLVNTTKEQLSNVPTVDDYKKIDFSATNWDKGLSNFWQTLTGGTSGTNGTNGTSGTNAGSKGVTPPPSK